MNVCAIVVAAGKGTRMGVNINKVYLELKGYPVLLYALKLFQRSPLIKNIIIVAAEGQEAKAAEIVAKYGISKAGLIVKGGNSRYESVKNALAFVEEKTDFVAVHDGARPLLTEEDLVKVIYAAESADGAILAYPMQDSIKQSEDISVKKSLERKELWGAMTPQVFAFTKLLRAYEAGNETATDDSQLVEEVGGKDLIVEGRKDNLKITTPLDLRLAELILESRGANK